MILFEFESGHGTNLAAGSPQSIDVHTNRFIVINKTSKMERKKKKTQK